MNKIIIWLSATRPKTLLASISPVLLGSTLSYAEGFFSLPICIVLFVTCILLQILTNLANDYYDFIKGGDTIERVGPRRAVVSGDISPHNMKVGIIFIVCLVVCFGLYLTYLTNYWILIIGIFSLFFAIIYTGGPFPLAYKGLGELFVFIFFGPIAVVGSYYCYTFSTPWYVFYLSIPSGALATVILLTNNIRDYELDKKVGKKTFVVRMGVSFAKGCYAFLLLLCFIIPLSFTSHSPLMPLFCIIPVLGFSRSIYFIYTYKNPTELNLLLAKNSLLLFMYSLAIALGYLYSHAV